MWFKGLPIFSPYRLLFISQLQREPVQVLQQRLAYTALVPAVMKQQQRNAIECLFPTDLKNADGSTESIFKVNMKRM